MLQFGLTLPPVASDHTVFVKDVPSRNGYVHLQTPAAIQNASDLLAYMSQLGFSAVDHALNCYDYFSASKRLLDVEVDIWVKLARLQLNGSCSCMSLAPFLRRLVNLRSIKGNLELPCDSPHESVFAFLSTLPCQSTLTHVDLSVYSVKKFGRAFKWSQAINSQNFPALQSIDISYSDTIFVQQHKIAYFLSTELKSLSESKPSMIIRLSIDLDLCVQFDDTVAEFGGTVLIKNGEVQLDLNFRLEEDAEEICNESELSSEILTQLKDGGWEKEVKRLLQL